MENLNTDQGATELPNNLTVNSLKSFRKYSDVEDFYRFVYENKIRQEAYIMLSRLMEHKRESKKLSKTNFE